MTKFFIAKQLSGKRIVTDGGENFGRLVDVNINEVTGKIEDLIVEPNPDSESANKLKKEDSMIHIPYETVLAIKDFVIIEKRKLFY